MKNVNETALTPATGATLVADLCAQMRSNILSLRFRPGSKLGIKRLADHYQLSQTPIREALNRLSSEGIVENKDRRGFFVPEISATELRELTEARCLVECAALKQSIARANADWEETLLVVHHRLARTPRSLNDETFEDNPEWELNHRTFHQTLIGNCGAPQLIQFCDLLVNKLFRYRRLSIEKVFTKRRFEDEHKQLVDLVISKNADEAAALLDRHFRLTAEPILEDASAFTFD